MADDVTTWHHGLMARWWANFNHGGPEIDTYRRWFTPNLPVLDAACGTGRLLVPWAADGVDIDGVDASADMIDMCRRASDAAGVSPSLFVQPLHRLVLPRRYGTVVVCGSYGLGGSADDDDATLRRIHDHLLPGGSLILDYEIEEFDVARLARFEARPADSTPPPPADRRRADDGFDYALRHRMVAIDVDRRQVTREMQAWQWDGDQLVAHETHLLTANVYTAEQVTAALAEAGFVDIVDYAGDHELVQRPTERVHVWVAHRGGATSEP
jgi:SAM-dependent methyltransferase